MEDAGTYALKVELFMRHVFLVQPKNQKEGCFTHLVVKHVDQKQGFEISVKDFCQTSHHETSSWVDV